MRRVVTDRSGLQGLLLAGAVVVASIGAALVTAEVAPAPAAAQEAAPPGGGPPGGAPLGGAQPSNEGLAAKVLSSARARYASMHTLHASFEGAATVLGAERPIEGAIDWRAPDASRVEIRFASAGTRTIRSQEGDRVRRWQGTAAGLEELEPETTDVPASLPLVPPFETIDESTLAIRDFRNERGRPPVIEIEARLARPIDAFTSTRLGIEDRTWLIRTLELRSEEGRSKVTVRFRDVRVDEPLPEGTFGPPRSRD